MVASPALGRSSPTIRRIVVDYPSRSPRRGAVRRCRRHGRIVRRAKRSGAARTAASTTLTSFGDASRTAPPGRPDGSEPSATDPARYSALVYRSLSYPDDIVTTPVFPQLLARNLEGLEVELPDAFVGHLNLVAIAFRREHQGLVDSWLPWFDQQTASHPDLRFYEVPTIGRVWAPVRNFIDGAMASAIREPVILQRTLTVYGDVSRVTTPLGIDDRSTIAVVLVDQSGHVLWLGHGRFSEPLAHDLEKAMADNLR
jgi:hypothetical protein